MIPYGRQDVHDADVQAVLKVLNSDFLTQGPQVPLFEQAVTNHCGNTHGVAVNSGTAALHIACLAMGLGVGDWLWTSPITFTASANCARYCGASVDFVDIDPVTYNLCPSALERKLVAAKAKGRLPKVVVAVHMCGQPSEMERIHALSQEYDFYVIEDACHALGAEYQGKPVGSGQYSDVTVFSFHPVKIITTGEGGIALTRHDHLAERMRLFRSHGITRDLPDGASHEEGPWEYQQRELGFNYRLSDLQAALGISQIQRLSNYVGQRQRIAQRYDERLRGLPVRIPQVLEGRKSAYHLYAIRLQLDEISVTRRQVYDALRAASVGVQVHYIPVHTQPYYQQLGFGWGDFPAAEAYYRETLSLPMYPTLTDEQQDYVVQTLMNILV
jgi:UDP-4-amino-4,6-dideoxy-N-acetyl-beta-L-altrosamine transaminase